MQIDDMLDAAVQRVAETVRDNDESYRAQTFRILRYGLERGDLPQENERSMVGLLLLVLGGAAAEALAFAGDMMNGTAADAQWVTSYVCAALEVGQPALGAALYSRLTELDGAGLREIYCAKALELIEEGRYSEATDWLELDLQLPVPRTSMAPMVTLHRIAGYATCHAKAIAPVLNIDTNEIEFPSELRLRIQTLFAAELERLRAMLSLNSSLAYGMCFDLARLAGGPAAAALADAEPLAELLNAHIAETIEVSIRAMGIDLADTDC